MYEMTVSPIVTLTEILTVALAVIIPIIWWWQSVNTGRECAKGMVVTLWMFHILLFYAIVLLNRYGIVTIDYPVVFLTGWSAALRFHGLITLLLIALLNIQETKLIKRKVQGLINGSIDRDKTGC